MRFYALHVNTLFQYSNCMHGFNTLFQYSKSMHGFNTLFEQSVSTFNNRVNAPFGIVCLGLFCTVCVCVLRIPHFVYICVAEADGNCCDVPGKGCAESSERVQKKPDPKKGPSCVFRRDLKLYALTTDQF